MGPTREADASRGDIEDPGVSPQGSEKDCSPLVLQTVTSESEWPGTLTVRMLHLQPVVY